MNDEHTRFGRRALLGRLGAGAAGLLPVLSARRGASAPRAPKRLIIITWPNGVLHDDFWPQATPDGFTIRDDENSPLRALRPHQKDILVVGGLELANHRANKRGAGHAAQPALLTGVKPVSCRCSTHDNANITAGGPSVDLFIANELAKRDPTPLRSLVLQTTFTNPEDRYVSFRGGPIGGKANAPTPETDVYRLFDTLFGQVAGGGAKAWHHRRSVLDGIARDLARFARDLGGEDRAIVEQHLTTVRAIERRLTTPVPAGRCSMDGLPRLPPERKDFTGFQSPFLDEGQRLQADMVVAAMRCDLTRVATLNWGDSVNAGYVFWWLGAALTEGRDPDNAGFGGKYRHHHEIAHNANRGEAHRRRKNLVDGWFFSQFAHVLDNLARTPDVDGRRMLDNTVVWMCNIFSSGSSHTVQDMPWVLGGSCGGHFKTGRLVRRAGGEGLAPHNGLLAELARGMGVPVPHFGDPAFHRELPALRG